MNILIFWFLQLIIFFYYFCFPRQKFTHLIFIRLSYLMFIFFTWMNYELIEIQFLSTGTHQAIFATTIMILAFLRTLYITQGQDIKQLLVLNMSLSFVPFALQTSSLFVYIFAIIAIVVLKNIELSFSNNSNIKKFFSLITHDGFAILILLTSFVIYNLSIQQDQVGIANHANMFRIFSCIGVTSVIMYFLMIAPVGHRKSMLLKLFDRNTTFSMLGIYLPVIAYSLIKFNSILLIGVNIAFREAYTTFLLSVVCISFAYHIIRAFWSKKTSYILMNLFVANLSLVLLMLLINTYDNFNQVLLLFILSVIGSFLPAMLVVKFYNNRVDLLFNNRLFLIGISISAYNIVSLPFSLGFAGKMMLWSLVIDFLPLWVTIILGTFFVIQAFIILKLLKYALTEYVSEKNMVFQKRFAIVFVTIFAFIISVGLFPQMYLY